mmetsp:Transcript_32701/g.91576  ORF Transcript_32701/g.91576 Transcript_32701/m.91576 type:complete len:207 (+) Transcript_32701:257-877(+)
MRPSRNSRPWRRWPTSRRRRSAWRPRSRRRAARRRAWPACGANWSGCAGSSGRPTASCTSPRPAWRRTSTGWSSCNTRRSSWAPAKTSASPRSPRARALKSPRRRRRSRAGGGGSCGRSGTPWSSPRRSRPTRWCRWTCTASRGCFSATGTAWRGASGTSARTGRARCRWARSGQATWLALTTAGNTTGKARARRCRPPSSWRASR